jgi:hypothetical protein
VAFFFKQRSDLRPGTRITLDGEIVRHFPEETDGKAN